MDLMQNLFALIPSQDLLVKKHLLEKKTISGPQSSFKPDGNE